MEFEKYDWKEVRSDAFIFDKEGDSIHGTLVSVDNSPQYDNKVYILETQDGMKTIFGTKALDTQMSRVKIGEMVFIKFLGMKRSDLSKRLYKDYNIKIGTLKGGQS